MLTTLLLLLAPLASPSDPVPLRAAVPPNPAARPAEPGPSAELGPMMLASALDPVDDEAVKDFKKFFRNLELPAERLEAVLTLEGNESVGVVGALVPLLGDGDAIVVDAAVRVLSGFETRPPVDALLEAFASTRDEAERVGLLAILQQGAYDNLGDVVLEALTDRSWAVRRQAILALAADAKTGTPIATRIAEVAGDSEVAVRCAVLDALSAARAREVLPLAQERLADDAWQVRVSAIDALRLVRDKSSIPLLIARFDVEEGRLVQDLGMALDGITAREVGARPDQWKRFWESVKDRYVIPTDEEVAKWAEARAKTAALYSAPSSTTFHGIETPSRAILFVIDVSGSMEDLVIEKENYEADAYPSWARIDIVKTELARTIEGLEPYVKFGIIAFATETNQWKRSLVPANVINKRSALSFVEKLEPLGGNSKADLVEVGLAAPGDLSAGKTNTYGALALGLGLTGNGGTFAKPSKEKYIGDVDTIFFLSDGKPTTGDYVEEKVILERIRAANELRKVVLHTIAIGNFSKGFMEALAIQNGGVFVDLGK